VEGRRFVGMDLNPEYLKLATARIEEARREGKA
jgi:DNA modification methylase